MFIELIIFTSTDKEECTLQVQEMPRVAVLASMKTPINSSSLSHRIVRPLSVSNVKIHEHSPIKIKPRKLVLPENENDDSEKENEQTMKGTSVKKTRIRIHKQKQSKAVTVFKDPPTVAQIRKLSPSSSTVKQRPTRMLRSKTSHKEVMQGASEYESLSKVCQALEIRIDSPGDCSEIHQFSVENRKQSSSVNNTQALPAHVPASEQAGQINREPGVSEISAKHASVLKAPKLKTYSRQKSTVQFKNKCQMSQEDENGGDSVNTVKENKKTKNTGKQSCSSKGIRKMSPDSSLTVKQTRRGGKSESVASYVRTSGSSKSSLQENLNEELINEMANINLDSEKFKLGSASHTIEKGKERKSQRSVKASEFLFTPLRTKARKQHEETIVPSSPDEHLDASRKTAVLPEENKGTEQRKILVSESSSSSEEKPSNLKACISSGKDKTLQKMTVLSQENKGTERSKKLVFSSSSSEQEKPSNLKACISSDKDKPLQKMTVLSQENKGTEGRKKLVFSSSSSEQEKPSNLKACISSDEDKTLQKMTVLPKENKRTERRKKLVFSSSSSEEKPANLKACISSDKDKTLQTMKPRNGVSSSKKKQLLPRHPFILN
jgi:hypothetical protein